MAFYGSDVSKQIPHFCQGFLPAYRQILLVGEDQEDGIPELVLVQHALEFLPGLDNTIAIVAINDEDDALGVLEVVSPQRSDLVLSTDVPHGELDVLVLDSLNVEAFSPLVSNSSSNFSDDVTVAASWVIPMVGMVVTISPSFSL